MAGNYEKTLYKLVRHVSGKKKNDCVLVIPCAESDSAFAGRHLAVLEKQTTDKFDVLIISGKPLKFKTKVNVLYFRENYPLGSSGGFGLGQVLGYTLGYEYVMATDVGVTPCSNDVIETLKRRAAAEQKLVVPLSMGLKEEIGNPEQYGICPRKVLEEDGFLFFRLYKGGEDGEYMNRLIMDGKFVVERTVGIQHEVLSPDIIAVLKSRGNKHIYYKKSNVLNHIMLARSALERGRIPSLILCVKLAWVEAIKTRFFYAAYPDFVEPVMQALWLDMDGVIPGRTTAIKTLEKKSGMQGVVLDCDGMKRPNTVSFGPGKFQTALGIVQVLLSGADYLEPTHEFLTRRRNLLAIVLVLKPIRYTDNKIYSYGAGWTQVFLNAVETAALAPFFLAEIAISVLRVPRKEYPQTLTNLELNLGIYLRYLQKLTGKEGIPAEKS